MIMRQHIVLHGRGFRSRSTLGGAASAARVTPAAPCPYHRITCPYHRINCTSLQFDEGSILWASVEVRHHEIETCWQYFGSASADFL
jgi:hypothetical protein